MDGVFLGCNAELLTFPKKKKKKTYIALYIMQPAGFPFQLI